jgi:hypothetical protein
VDSASKTGNRIATTVIMWTALGVAVAALALWFMNVIAPPAWIIGGATAIMVLLAAARHRKKADR